MPMTEVHVHQQCPGSFPPPEPSRLKSDADSDDAGMSKRAFAATGIDRWASGRQALRAADPRMAELIAADPDLDPDALFDGWPSDLWGALVLQVIGQQLSRAAASAILGRLEALHGEQLPTPAQLLDTDAETLRRIGLSRAKAAYLHDLAARLEDGRLDLERLRTLDDDHARDELTQVKGVGRFTADGVLMLALRRPDVWPAADLALRRAVERVWALDPPASVAQVDALGERFRPWRTLAATYLYRAPTA
jgi:DNA-3-methyladenine glycosylase II